VTEDLAIPRFLDRRAAPGPHDITQQCSKCGDAAEFGYKIEGAMQWFCDKHKISQNYADARVPKVSESKQTVDDGLSGELAARADKIREICHCLSEHVIDHIVIIGRNLVEAREICPHGEWLPWLKREFDWSHSTADRFMQVYRMKDKLPTVGNFKILLNTLYLLAAPSTPPKVRQDIKERVESGERVSGARVKDAIAEAMKPPSKSSPSRATTSDPSPNHKQIAAGLTLARQMSLPTLDQFMVGLKQIRREKKRHS
jgi:hypothetical protein